MESSNVHIRIFQRRTVRLEFHRGPEDAECRGCNIDTDKVGDPDVKIIDEGAVGLWTRP